MALLQTIRNFQTDRLNNPDDFCITLARQKIAPMWSVATRRRF